MLLGLEAIDKGVIETGKTVIFGYYQQTQISFPDNKRVIDVIKDISEYLILGNGEKISASHLLEKFLFPMNQQFTFAQNLS